MFGDRVVIQAQNISIFLGMGVGVGMPFPYYIREPNYTLVAMGRKCFNCVWCIYLRRYMRSYQTVGMFDPNNNVCYFCHASHDIFA
jgi:hypothetical protein